MSTPARVFALFVSLLLIFSLIGCAGGGGEGDSSAADGAPVGGASAQSSQPAPESAPAGQPSSQEVSEAPAREPIGSPAVIAYPELVTEELAVSPLYRQALERPSVIVYHGSETEVLTDPQPVLDFLTAVEEGKDWDLYIYSFWPYAIGRGCTLDHFISEQGTVRHSGTFEGDWESITEGGKSRAGRIYLNEYGYFCYNNDSGIQVVSDRALYPDAEERRRLKKTYIDPIFYTAIAATDEWSSPQELGKRLWLFEDIYYYENDDSPWDRFGSDWPVEYIVETLSRYFDGVTADMLIYGGKYGAEYDPQANTIHYEGGRGGAPSPVRVTGWAREGDRLAIDYQSYYYYTGEPFEEDSGRTLTVRILEDGSFRYLSNLRKKG